jgi:hypothetical protein
MNIQDKAAIKSMIVSGNLEEAIPAFLKASAQHSSRLSDDITLQSSRFNRLKQEIRDGLVDKAAADIQTARITKALIDLLADVPGTGGPSIIPPPAIQVTSAGQINTIGEMSGGSITYSPQQSPDAQKPEIRKTILFLGANPKETDQLRLGQEARDIEEGVRRSRQRDDFQFVTKWAVRTTDLRRHLLDEYPKIVHFSGHGTKTNGLVFEDINGATKLVGSQSLANLFSVFSDTIECVVLNACYSEEQADAIVQHIPYVIGMNNAIQDETAIQFAVAFYDALASGRGGVEFAFKYACAAIEVENLKGSDIPQLKKKTG